MLLSGALFVLFLAGCWLYCLTDAALTPAAEYRRLPKAAWLGIIAATFIVGAIAWLLARRSARTRSWATGYVGRATLVDPADTDPTWYPNWESAMSAATQFGYQVGSVSAGSTSVARPT